MRASVLLALLVVSLVPGTNACTESHFAGCVGDCEGNKVCDQNRCVCVSPPSPCPGGSLENCMQQCPATNYGICVGVCNKKCGEAEIHNTTSVSDIAAPLRVGAAAMDMPLYCRLLQKGLELATFSPIIADTNISMTTHVTGLGNIDMSASHLEIASAKVVDCAASVDDKGVFNVGVTRLDLQLNKVEWAYKQKSWPHIWDKGSAKGSSSISFNVSIDTNADKQQLFDINLAQFDFDMGATHHKGLTAALMKLTHMLRPMVSEVVKHEAKKTLQDSLDLIHSKGGCAFIHNVLAGVDMTTISFAADNNTVHIPLVGNVEISVDSKWVSQPTSMDCKAVGFTGKTLVAHIENVPFSAGFAWAYRKNGSTFWHNHGNGSMSIVAGTELHIDLLNAANTVLKVDLPVLELKLHAAEHAWIYNALTGIMVPLVHETLKLSGGKDLTRYVRKCLEDPTCPHIHPQPATTKFVGSSHRGSTTEIVV